MAFPTPKNETLWVSVKKTILLIALVSLFVQLCACSEGANYAPVSDISMIDPIPKSGSHRVMQGETLYEIAWRYGLDYRYLAERNQIKPPYTIHVGQTVLLQGGNSIIISLSNSDVEAESPQPVLAKSEPNSKITVKEPVQSDFSIPRWSWPARGQVLGKFSGSNKGINIGGRKGEAVLASAAGRVVYCGNGLRGYGNLIILKHNNIYLSAYAHNNKVYVREGDLVSKGQKIAEMGNTGTDKVMLHFEIRQAGKPVDPLSLLGS